MKKKNINKAGLIIFLILSFLYGTFQYSDIQERTNKSKPYYDELYLLIEWLKTNTGEKDVIMTQWTLGPFLYGISNSNVVATSKVYPSEVSVVGERYADIARFFYSQTEEDVLRIVQKYNVTHVVVPVQFTFGMCGYINSCNSRNNEHIMANRFLANETLKNFEKIFYNEEFMVYRVREFEPTSDPLQNLLRNATLEYQSKHQKKVPSKNVVATVVPHDIFYANQILVENLDLIPGNFERIIMLGPDHRSRGGYPITSSDSPFSVYGNSIDIRTIESLEILIDNEIHRQEWSLRTIVPFVLDWSPNIKITPVLFRHDVEYDDAVSFGKKLAREIDNKTLVLASIDFSHVIPANEELGFIEDNKSLDVLMTMDKERVDTLVTEGKPAIVAMLAALEEIKVKNTRLINISRASYPARNSTQTVGYISIHYLR